MKIQPFNFCSCSFNLWKWDFVSWKNDIGQRFIKEKTIWTRQGRGLIRSRPRDGLSTTFKLTLCPYLHSTFHIGPWYEIADLVIKSWFTSCKLHHGQVVSATVPLGQLNWASELIEVRVDPRGFLGLRVWGQGLTKSSFIIVQPR